MGDREYGVDPGRIESIAREIVEVHQSGAEVALVIGAGNIVRGMQAAESGMDRATADYAGMLATLLNSLTVQDALERHGAQTRVLSAITVAEVYAGQGTRQSKQASKVFLISFASHM